MNQILRKFSQIEETSCHDVATTGMNAEDNLTKVKLKIYWNIIMVVNRYQFMIPWKKILQIYPLTVICPWKIRRNDVLKILSWAKPIQMELSNILRKKSIFERWKRDQLVFGICPTFQYCVLITLQRRVSIMWRKRDLFNVLQRFRRHPIYIRNRDPVWRSKLPPIHWSFHGLI